MAFRERVWCGALALATMLSSAALGGCMADVDDVDDTEEDVVEGESALSSNATFNNEDDHFEQHVQLPKGEFGLYDREGRLLATVDASKSVGWIQGHERVDTKRAGSLYWLWGYPSGVDASGYVRANVISGERGIVPVGERGASNHNGRQAPLTGATKTVSVTPLPSDFRHATTKGFSASRAGDVNAVGQYAVSKVSAEHAYLTWSTPWNAQAKRPLSGGGIVRSVVRDGETFHLAAVRSIVMPAYSPAGAKIGTITWSYGYVRQNGERVFGWMIRSHQRRGEAPVAHLR